MVRNVYAATEGECEEKLAQLIHKNEAGDRCEERRGKGGYNM